MKEVQRLEGHNDRVWSLDWNPATGHAGTPLVFASCSGDKTVRIWEQDLSSGLWACKVSSSLLIITLIILVYIYRNRSCIVLFLIMISEFGNDVQAVLDETHTRTVRSCAWSPSGKLLATASFDATTAIWENVGGDFECVATLEVCCCCVTSYSLIIWMCLFFYHCSFLVLL